MTVEAMVGCVIVLVSLGLLVGLTVWSHRAINRIAERDLKSVRDIVKDLRNGG